MKNKKIILIVLLVVSIFLLIISQMSSIRRGFLYLTQKPSEQEVADMNNCYDIIVDCFENGFNAAEAKENKAKLKVFLDKNVTTRLYLESDFSKNPISFGTLKYAPQNNNDAAAYHSRDLILAVYLMCVLETEPENLFEEFNYFLDGIWLGYENEFVCLISKSDISKDEYAVVCDTYKKFAETLDNPRDRVEAYSIASRLYSEYNKNNTDNTFPADEQLVMNMRECINSENYNDGIWYGFSQNTSYERIINNTTAKQVADMLIFGFLYK